MRGANHAAEIDVVNFFGSINQDWLRENLPLPTGLVDSVVCAKFANLVPTDAISRVRYQECRLGIPQGSSLSPLIGEVVIASVLAPFGTCGLVAYADNVLCVGHSRREVDDDIQSLRGFFQDHPAGCFRTTYTETRRFADGVEFLGQRLLNNADNRLSVRPTTGKLIAFVKEARAASLSGDPGFNDRARGWVNAHRIWDGVEDWSGAVMRSFRPGNVPFRASEALSYAKLVDAPFCEIGHL